MTREEENILAAKSLSGDQAAFGALADAFSAPVFGLLLRLLGNRAEAEDAAQDVFLRVYKGLATYDPQYPFISWLLAIAHNRGVDLLKARRHWLVSIDDPEAPLDIEDPVRMGEGLERKLDAVELWRAVDTLPPLWREALLLRHQQDLEYSEMAAVMNLPLGTVKTILYRARQALKAMALSGELKLSAPGTVLSEERQKL